MGAIRLFHSIFSRQHSVPGTRRPSPTINVPRGHVAVYVGESRRRFVIPMSYLEDPFFRALLQRVGEEIGFQHPMGALTIPFAVEEDIDRTLTAHLIEANY